jgi:hypothetical protein
MNLIPPWRQSDVNTKIQFQGRPPKKQTPDSLRVVTTVFYFSDAVCVVSYPTFIISWGKIGLWHHMCASSLINLEKTEDNIVWDFRFSRRREQRRLSSEMIGDRPDDGGIKHLWNVAQFLPDTRRNIPEDSHFHARRHENLKSHIEIFLCRLVRECVLARNPLHL